MTAGLRALLEGVIDYAGLFPPARLPLGEAVRNYARYRRDPDRWMLGRFVCPAARLAELAPLLAELFPEGERVVLSVLGRGGESCPEFAENLAADLKDVVDFRERHGARADVGVFETRLPAGVPGDYFRVVSAGWETSFLPPPARYYEASPCPAWRDSLAAMLALIAPHCAGFKLRCGGLEAKAFPTVEQVAAVVVACRDARVPLKFTSGLHHAVRRFDPGLRVRMHGFVNVFTGGVLAHARGLTEEQLRPVLEDEDADDFWFDDAGLGWKDYGATTEEVGAARRRVVSFGSCSFDEPRDDLRALGWLI
jgi:hypothetical protein